MSTESTVMVWDNALRASEWETARSLLTDDAVYTAPAPFIDCSDPDAIVDLMKSYKGVVPDVELVDLEVIGDSAIAFLHQPAWDSDWVQVITVRGDRIARLEDFESEEAALAALA